MVPQRRMWSVKVNQQFPFLYVKFRFFGFLYFFFQILELIIKFLLFLVWDLPFLMLPDKYCSKSMRSFLKNVDCVLLLKKFNQFFFRRLFFFFISKLWSDDQRGLYFSKKSIKISFSSFDNFLFTTCSSAILFIFICMRKEVRIKTWNMYFN